MGIVDHRKYLRGTDIRDFPDARFRNAADTWRRIWRAPRRCARPWQLHRRVRLWRQRILTALLVDRFGRQSSSAALCYWRSLWQRDRLDRALLVEYLAAMGVVVDDEARYAEVALVKDRKSVV